MSPGVRGPRGSRQKLHLRQGLGPGAPTPSQVSPEGLKEEADLLTSRTVLSWDFPGGPVVKICIPSAGGMGSVPGQGTKTSHGKQTKKNGPFIPDRKPANRSQGLKWILSVCPPPPPCL